MKFFTSNFFDFVPWAHNFWMNYFLHNVSEKIRICIFNNEVKKYVQVTNWEVYMCCK